MIKYYILSFIIGLLIGVLWLLFRNKKESLNLPPTSTGYSFKIDFGTTDSEDMRVISPRYKEEDNKRKWDKIGWY